MLRAAPTARGCSSPLTPGGELQLEVAGALLARLRKPPPGAVEANPLGAEGGLHGYWAPHVDKANIETYDISAVLYLTTGGGVDFDGGELAFNDADGIDYLVQPRFGRLCLFGSGAENLHQVFPVLGGERLALSVWFTATATH